MTDTHTDHRACIVLDMPTDLRVDGLPPVAGKRQINLASPRPRFSWVVPVGQSQTAVELRLSELSTGNPGTVGARTSTIGEADVLSPSADAAFVGVIETDDPHTVLPHELRARTRYGWAVRLRDEAGNWSPWSTPTVTETGPFSVDDWHSVWVSHPPLATLRTRLPLGAEVRRALLYLTAQGLVRAVVNGSTVNPEATDATRTDYVRALFRTYDVSDLCRTGENTLDLTLASGEWERTETDPRVLAELVVECSDGTVHRMGTGEVMSVAASEVTVQEPFYLERHDPSAASSDFVPARQLKVHRGVRMPTSAQEAPLYVEPDQTPPLHNVLAIRPTELARIDGARVFDVGVNVAGRTRLELVENVPSGITVRLVHGEQLDSAGRLDTSNLMMPFDHDRVRQALEYVTTGDTDQTGESQIYEPWFAYHGFRYVEIQGLPQDATIELTVHTHHTDLARTGSLVTDDDRVNRLIERAQRTFLNNVHGIPEDCPTREQSGWTGDAASVTEFAYATFDLEAFYRKWLADLRTSQLPDGGIPGIAPDYRDAKMLAEPVWGAALHRVLVNHWYHYGDRRVIDDNLPALRRWADFQLSCRDEAGVVSKSPISYGSDWLALQQTPPPIHHTAATIDCLDMLAELEEAVEHLDSARLRRDQAESLRESARAVFFDPTTGGFGSGSQGSYACAVEAGILTGDDAQRAARRIADDVRARGNRVSSGFGATRTVTRALARSGLSQVLFDTLQQPEEPGVGAMVDHGPGTLWECWWIDPYNTGTSSLDHVGLGGPFASWAWHFLAGVRPTAAGYARFEVAPRFVTGVERLELEEQTVRGTVRFCYRRDGEFLRANLTVPAGSQATVRLPGAAPLVESAGDHEYELPWPATDPQLPPADSAGWRPAAAAPVSCDVSGRWDLLDAAIASGRVHTEGAHSEVLPDGIVCMPVPHAQERGPVLRVMADDPNPQTAPMARLDFSDAPLDLADVTFVYAMIDLCLPEVIGPLESLIVLHSADGTTKRATCRFWPAGWARAVVDIADWPGRSAVIAIETGTVIDRSDDAADQKRHHPPGFHLGEVGYSTLKRLW